MVLAASQENRAQPLNLSKISIFELAESVASDLEFEPGDNIHQVVKSLGGHVEVEDELMSDPEHTGSLFVYSPERFRIVIPSHTSVARDRFTIAHELGHFFLHYLFQAQDEDDLIGKQLVAFRKDSARVEWEANWFAAAFLMPEEEFRGEFRKKKGDLSRLADHFKVSRSAVDVRAQDLGLE